MYFYTHLELDDSLHSSESEEIKLQSSQNIMTISFNTNTVDAATQTIESTSTSTSDAVMVQLDRITDLINYVTTELSVHGSDISEIHQTTTVFPRIVRAQSINFTAVMLCDQFEGAI